MAGSHGIDLSSVDIDQVSEVEFNVLHNHTKLTSDCRLCGKRVQVSKVFNHIFFKHHIKLNIAIDMVRRYGQKNSFFSMGYQATILTTVFGYSQANQSFTYQKSYQRLSRLLV